jgi:hypothetical protein
MRTTSPQVHQKAETSDAARRHYIPKQKRKAANCSAYNASTSQRRHLARASARYPHC